MALRSYGGRRLTVRLCVRLCGRLCGRLHGFAPSPPMQGRIAGHGARPAIPAITPRGQLDIFIRARFPPLAAGPLIYIPERDSTSTHPFMRDLAFLISLAEKKSSGSTRSMGYSGR